MGILQSFNFACFKCFLLLALMVSLVSCSEESGGSTMSLSWTVPEQRESGVFLDPSDVAGFRIYYGRQSGEYPNKAEINSGFSVEASIGGVPPGIYYVVVTVVDTDGLESSMSPEIVLEI